MEKGPRFEIRFDVDAIDEYERLDASVRRLVNRRLEELEVRADLIGKTLINKQETKLHGCRELKLRKIGIRIIFRITESVVQVLRVVQIVAIERRESGRVFQIANRRLSRLKGLSLQQA